MREVRISGLVRIKIAELESYLIDELKLSEEAALRRSTRMREFVHAFRNAADHPLCRFKKWRIMVIDALYLRKIGFSHMKFRAWHHR